MTVTRLLARRHNLPAAAGKATWRERGKAFRGAGLALLMPVILLGGMLGGLFTATEAAAVAATYALLVTLFVLKTLDFAEMRRVFIATAVQSGVILMLVGAAVTFGWLVTVSGMAEQMAATITGITDDPLLLLLLLNLLLFVIGMFLDAGPAILILGPVLAPIFVSLGVYPIHFALIMCINLTVGLATPPMGLVLFVVASLANILRKQRQQVAQVEVTAESERDDEPPWRFRKIRILYKITGRGLDAERVRRAIDLAEQKYCGVYATLRDAVEITSQFEIIEA